MAFVQDKSANGSSTAPQAVFDSTPTQGNLLVCWVASAAATAITMSSAGWTALTSIATGSGGSARASRMFYKLAGAGESTTVTAVSANANWGIIIAEHSGVNKINPLNIENNQGNASGTAQATPTVAPVGTGNALIIATASIRNVGQSFSNETINSSTSGVTEREENASNNASVVMYDKDITGLTGTYAGSVDAAVAAVGTGGIAIFNVGGIDLDAVSTSGSKSNIDPWDWTHACTGSDRMLVVTVSSYNQHPTGVTYNSVALTQQQATNNGIAYASIWYLKNPSSGSNTVSVDFAGGAWGQAGAISLVNTDQSSQPDASVAENGTSATTNVLNLTTGVVNTVIIDAISIDTILSNDNLARNAAQTNIYTTQNVSFVDVGASYKGIGATGAQTMTWTWTVVASTAPYAHVGLSVKVATAAAGSTYPGYYGAPGWW